jgi:D-alanyl-D-alanine dipeptidase
MKTAFLRRFAYGCIAFSLFSLQAKCESKLPGSFVYLRDIDASIPQEIKYATFDNFTGAPVPGYQAGECILEKSTAQALSLVQHELRAAGLSLLIYDCYRPKRSVDAFVQWSRSTAAPDTSRFYPRISKAKLFEAGYIAKRSGHSIGDTVDLSLTKLPLAEAARFDAADRYGPCNGPYPARAPSIGIDMGTSFDCFDTMSATVSVGISNDQREWRQRLVHAMNKYAHFAQHRPSRSPSRNVSVVSRTPIWHPVKPCQRFCDSERKFNPFNGPGSVRQRPMLRCSECRTRSMASASSATAWLAQADL